MNKKVHLILFLIYNIIFADDIVNINRNKVVEYINDIKRKWPINNDNLENAEFKELLMGELGKLSLIEIVNLKKYFSPLLSSIIINYINNLDSKKREKNIILLLNCDPRVLSDNNHILETNMKLLMDNLKNIDINQGILNFSDIIIKNIIKYIKSLQREQKIEYTNSPLMFMFDEKIDLINAFFYINNDNILLNDPWNCYIESYRQYLLKKQTEISIITLFNIKKLIVNTLSSIHISEEQKQILIDNKANLSIKILDDFLEKSIINKLKDNDIDWNIKEELVKEHSSSLKFLLTINDGLMKCEKDVDKGNAYAYYLMLSNFFVPYVSKNLLNINNDYNVKKVIGISWIFYFLYKGMKYRQGLPKGMELRKILAASVNKRLRSMLEEMNDREKNNFNYNKNELLKLIKKKKEIEKMRIVDE